MTKKIKNIQAENAPVAETPEAVGDTEVKELPDTVISEQTELTEKPDAVAEAALEEQTELAAGITLEPTASSQAGELAAKEEEVSLADRVRIISPARLVVRRFFRSRLSVVGLSIFIAVLLFSFLGPVFVPWGSDERDTSPAYSEQINNLLAHATDPNGEDYTYYTISTHNSTTINAKAPAFTYGINKKHKRALHVLGTDQSGYDILVRLMYGGRMSLLLSFMVVLVYTVMGVILGGLAGYFGGWVDMIIMRLVDILNCIPSLPIMLIIGAIFDNSGIDPNFKIYIMMGVLTLLSWPGTARLVRGQILFLREQEYMVAADALGFGVGRKIFKHLVPNVLPQIIVSMTLGLGGTILTESSLSFLGLGAPPSVASLGQMVSAVTGPAGQTILQYYPMIWLPAGIIIILAVVAFNFIGDGLRDALDPKMKR